MNSSKADIWVNFSLNFQSYLVFCLRLKFDRSQSELASEFDVDQATISRIERKQQGKDIHHNTLYVLDKYFSGVHVMDFLGPTFAKKFHAEFCEEVKTTSKRRSQLEEKFRDLLEAIDLIRKSRNSKKIESKIAA